MFEAGKLEWLVDDAKKSQQNRKKTSWSAFLKKAGQSDSTTELRVAVIPGLEKTGFKKILGF